MQKVAYICDNKTNKHRAIMTTAFGTIKFTKTTELTDGCFEWTGENVRIYRTGGIDCRGHFTYNLGTYAVEVNHKQMAVGIKTLKAAKEVAIYHASK